MKRTLIALALLAASPAAAYPYLTSDATSIVAGQSITFSVVIPWWDIPSPTIAGFAGGGGYWTSGDGQTDPNGYIGPYGGSETFTYLTPGEYTARVAGMVAYHSVVCDWGPVCYSLINGGTAPGSQNFVLYETITVASVPEPSTWALMLLGFAFFAMRGIWPGGRTHG